MTEQKKIENTHRTPCEELGYKVGDKFVVEGSYLFKDGTELYLVFDDDTTWPCFSIINKELSSSDIMHVDGISAFIPLDEVIKVSSTTTPTQYQFKKGDKVKVVKKCSSRTNCHYGEKWECVWVSAMDGIVGEVGEVIEIYDKVRDEVTGICVDFEYIRWNLPSDSLELVVEDTIADTQPDAIELMNAASEEISKFGDMVDSWLAKAEDKPQELLLDKFYKFKEELSYHSAVLVVGDSITLEFDDYEFSGDKERILKVMDMLLDLHG